MNLTVGLTDDPYRRWREHKHPYGFRYVAFGNEDQARRWENWLLARGCHGGPGGVGSQYGYWFPMYRTEQDSVLPTYRGFVPAPLYENMLALPVPTLPVLAPPVYPNVVGACTSHPAPVSAPAPSQPVNFLAPWSPRPVPGPVNVLTGLLGLNPVPVAALAWTWPL